MRNVVIRGVWSKTTNVYKGYAIAGVALANPTVLSVSYYDNYEFMGLNSIPANTDENLKYNAEPSYGTWYGVDYSETNKYKSKSLLTGIAIAQLDESASPAFLYAVMYYDNRDRLIQTKSANHLGGVEVEHIAYNFVGQPVKRKHIHSAIGMNTQTEEYIYTYDHAGRLTKTTHQLTDGTTVRPQTILAENTYDELGRLRESTANAKQALKSTYTYDVRSRTKGIAGTHFSQALEYTYGGNISAQEWTQANKTRKYVFAYDNLSRLTGAAYTGDGNYGTAYAYDRHGNITSLVRNGNTGTTTCGVIDNLTLTYNGNQLKNITESTANPTVSTSADFRKNTPCRIRNIFTTGTGI